MIAQQAHRLVNQLYLNRLSTKKPFIHEDKKSTIKYIDLAIMACKNRGSLYFELQVLRAAIGALPDQKSFFQKQQTVEIAKKLLVSSLHIAVQAGIGNIGGAVDTSTELSLDLIQKVYNKAVKGYRKRWYTEVCYIDYIKNQLLKSKNQKIKKDKLEKVKDLLKGKLMNVKTKDWQTIYAGIDLFTAIVVNSNDEDLIHSAYYGNKKKIPV